MDRSCNITSLWGNLPTFVSIRGGSSGIQWGGRRDRVNDMRIETYSDDRNHGGCDLQHQIKAAVSRWCREPREVGKMSFGNLVCRWSGLLVGLLEYCKQVLQ